MANPVLSARAFDSQRSLDAGVSPITGAENMTLAGTVHKTAALLVLLLGTGLVGWNATHVTKVIDASGIARNSVNFPGWVIVVALASLAIAMVTVFKQTAAPITAPLYALGEGLVVGAISHAYASQYSGVVPNAILATAVVFALMLGAYSNGIIRATPRFRRVVVTATFAVLVTYMLSLVLNLFGKSFPLLNDAGPLGILVSAVICLIAAFNLILDFDIIERGVAAGAPKYMEWYGAFGLLVTLVWLYMEMLRLLAKFSSRR